jgi:hypothetical protein
MMQVLCAESGAEKLELAEKAISAENSLTYCLSAGVFACAGPNGTCS